MNVVNISVVPSSKSKIKKKVNIAEEWQKVFKFMSDS